MTQKKPADTLVQDVTDVLLNAVQLCPGFDKLPEHKRKAIDSSLDAAARILVRNCIVLIASRDFHHAIARLGKFKVGDDIEGGVLLSRTDANALNWLHFMGRDVILSFIPPDVYVAAEEDFVEQILPTQPKKGEQLDIEDSIAEAQTNGAGEPQTIHDTNVDLNKVDYDPVTGEIIPEPPRPPRPPRDPNAPEAPQNIIKRTSMGSGVVNQMPKSMLNKMGNDEDWGNEAADEMDGDGQ